MSLTAITLLQQLDTLSAPELRRLLAEHLTCQKLGLYWVRDAISQQVAHSLPIGPTLQRTALQAALNRLTQKELHKELACLRWREASPSAWAAMTVLFA